jgi:hypothetical protein
MNNILAKLDDSSTALEVVVNLVTSIDAKLREMSNRLRSANAEESHRINS